MQKRTCANLSLSTIIIALLLTANVATAKEPELELKSPCQDVIDAADKYIGGLEDTVGKYRMLTKSQDDLVVKLTQQRDELATKKDGLPFYFWLIVGAGAYAVIDNIRR